MNVKDSDKEEIQTDNEEEEKRNVLFAEIEKKRKEEKRCVWSDR